MEEPQYPPLSTVSPALSHACGPRFGSVTIRDRGRLPHWELERGTYFVTFRLADSLPKSVLIEIAEHKRRLRMAQQSGRELLPMEKALAAKLNSKRIEGLLDSGQGRCWLRSSEIAKVVSDAIRHFDEQRYRLFAWCVMPNHVHAVFKVLANQSIGTIVGSWKGYSARKANLLLNRSGQFWQREYYDRLLRSSDELNRAVAYVAENPNNAQLVEWPWVWTRAAEDGPDTAGLEASAT